MIGKCPDCDHIRGACICKIMVRPMLNPGDEEKQIEIDEFEEKQQDLKDMIEDQIHKDLSKKLEESTLEANIVKELQEINKTLEKIEFTLSCLIPK